MWLPGWSKIKFLLCKEETPMKKNLGPLLALYPRSLNAMRCINEAAK